MPWHNVASCPLKKQVDDNLGTFVIKNWIHVLTTSSSYHPL